jgi:hypothetical protein
MNVSAQPVIDRAAPPRELISEEPRGRDRSEVVEVSRARTGERAAKASLRAQVARLEHELSAIVAEGFPFISAPIPRHEAIVGPCLLSLEELERSRDRLVGRGQEYGRLVAERAEHERQAHELLKRMKLEPGRHKFVRLPVNDLGQGGCGVWEVRPRLGLIGMLAGWWQVKLSSGCPLPRGSRSRRGPAATAPCMPGLGAPVPATTRRGVRSVATPTHAAVLESSSAGPALAEARS